MGGKSPRVRQREDRRPDDVPRPGSPAGTSALLLVAGGFKMMRGMGFHDHSATQFIEEKSLRWRPGQSRETPGHVA